MGDYIIKIPEIAQNIAIFLTPAELYNSCQVSKLWFVPFVRELWRSINASQWKHYALRSSLPRYSHYIHELECHDLISLGNLGQDCTRLRSLRISFTFFGDIQAVLPILRRSPAIEELWIYALSRIIQVDVSLEVIKAISDLKRLKRLRLRYFAVKLGTLKSILFHIPQLEELYVGFFKELTISGQGDFDEVDQSSSLHSQQLDVPSQLQSLCIEGSNFPYERVLMVIRQSPLLKSFSLWGDSITISLYMSPTLSEFCQGLRDFGPNLDSLSIDQNYVDLDGLICLLKAFPKLRKFEVGMILLEDHEIFEVLWQQENLKENLEEFTFKEPYSISECAEMVLRMLHECRSLRRVNLGGKMYVNQLLQLLGTAEANGYAFACHDLKVLEITVAGAGNWAPPAVLKERYDHTIIKPSDNNYERYDSLVRYLSKMPNLDLNSITFE